MRRRARTLVNIAPLAPTLALALTLACGPAGPGAEGDEAGESAGDETEAGTTGESESTDDELGEGESSEGTSTESSEGESTASGEDDMDGESSEGGEGGVGPFDPFEPGELPCASAGWDASLPVAAILGEGGAVSLMRADGSLLALDTSLPNAAADAELAVRFAEYGEWLATAVFDEVDGQANHRAMFRLYDHAGAVQWAYETTQYEPWGLYIADDGRLSARVDEWDAEGDSVFSMVVDEQGLVEHFHGGVLGRVDAEDWVPAWGGDGDYYWHNVTTQANTDASHYPWPERAEEQGTYRSSDGFLVYISDPGGGWALIEEHPTALLATPWPELGPYIEAGAARRDFSHLGRWVLFEPEDGYHLLRLVEGASEDWQLAPPPGKVRHACNGHDLSFDAKGDPLMVWRDDDSARAWVKPGVDADWEAVPDLHPVADTDRVSISAHGGTYVLHSRGPGLYNCDPEDSTWASPPADAVLGESTQIVRPSAGSKLIFKPRVQPKFASQGRCSVRELSEDPTVPWRFDDHESQAWFEAPLPGQVRWLQAAN
ncbi:hypothetical protein PPSIR1_12263 [Plesiocystis pacifica SIR-1]|uniref:Lipoprotein n=1 Tax=Plesiocystis pacifica SIR-1 TaxID=391625 RepID=A6G5Y2_9BACT|nr:hypothetical protein [Plesiocystis pacifica]EDM78756.1 hypothetical protein PPSIR1_12263 [Plesiocystis pacifica SIR-1]